jgi:invasion protein IalB
MHACPRTIRAAALTIAIAATAPLAAQTAAELPGGANSLQETYENWTVSCSLQGGAKRCALSQQELDQQSRQRVLAIELAPLADKADGTLVLPFGLLIDRGVTLRVDDSAPLPILRFRTCVPAGCLVTLAFDAKFVAELRKGAALKINAIADGGKDAAFSISLKGFPAAFDRTAALTK